MCGWRCRRTDGEPVPFDPDAVSPLQGLCALDFTHVLVNSELVNFLGKALPCIEIGFAEGSTRVRNNCTDLSQVKSNFSQFLKSGWRGGWGMAAGEDFEPACLELENYCSSDPSFLTRSGPDFFRKASDYRSCFGVGRSCSKVSLAEMDLVGLPE
jgi:hypothetical protein